ncbi:hypothetical protein Y032_0267g745 [Ancylostoma ceylanicum]|nr:hypothetical protein Y032_0267g745 [Ancylostoma ceylanicum]
MQRRMRLTHNMEDVSAHHATDIVQLNVGGKRYTTLFETLARSKSSFFNRIMRIDHVTGKVLLFRRNFMVDAEGAIFINRDGDLFAHALQFMRDGKRTALPEKVYTLKQLIRESEFFGMESWKQVLTEQLEIVEKKSNEIADILTGIDAHVGRLTESFYFNGFKK